MDNYIIGLTGKSKSGKDTAYELLDQHFEAIGVKCYRFAFADALKEYCADLNNEPVWLYHDDTEKEKPITGRSETRRECVQRIGEAMKVVDPDIWIRMVERDINFIDECTKANDGISLWIITDVRFDREAEWIVNRPESSMILEIQRDIKTNVPSHVSENGIDPKYINQTIVNDDIYRFQHLVYNAVFNHIGKARISSLPNQF